MDNSVMLDYLAVTIKGLAPDDVIEKILILPKDKFVLNEWGIKQVPTALCLLRDKGLFQ